MEMAKKKRRSVVWEFFKWTNYGKSQEVYCDICNYKTKICPVQRSTNRMLTHVRTKHQNELAYIENLMNNIVAKPKELVERISSFCDDRIESLNQVSNINVKENSFDSLFEEFDANFETFDGTQEPFKKQKINPIVIVHDFEGFQNESDLNEKKKSLLIGMKGDERKQEMGSFPGPSEASVGSAGDNPGASDDISIPLSPEQFMSEENEPIASGGGGGASCSGPSPASNPPRPESYKLRHNNHLTLVLESLAGDESFMDVTLTAQGKAIKAHKSVLSAVSPYFRSVLKSNPCQHPIIIMPRDIRFEELNSIISYIYRGEMTVAASDLSSLLKTAEILQVTGLSPSETTSGASGIMSQVHGFPAATRVPNFNTNVSHSFSKRNSQKQNQESIQHQQQDQDLQQQQLQQQQQQQQQQMEQDNVDDDDDETLNEDTNDSQGRIDPLDFLNTNMACVKEEVRSDDEAEKDDDDDGEQNLPANTSYSSPTHNEKESESVSPNIQNQLASGSIQNQLASGSIQNQLSSGSPNPFEDITSKPFNPGESEGTSSDNLQESQQSLTPFGCPYCFEIHRPFEMLQSHLRLKHPTKSSFPCGCGRVLFRMSAFVDHSKKCKF
ncbi:UNVERIFIED_CONTAM: hypothetical protein RMT77_013423 [Armadillidium vulgare]